MKRHLLLPLFTAAVACAAEPPVPKFRAVTIDDQIQIGYGLAVADVNGDGKPDILLADKRQIVWYENPGTPQSAPATWPKHVIAENLTLQDNVCIAAQDIDGDGKCELAVGAEWNPGDTEKSGAVFYLIPPADRTQRWEPVKFPSVEPTTHRMKWMRLEDGTWGLVVVPLHGRGNKNGEGAPVKVLLYHPPAQLNDPKGEWKSELIDGTMHMTHNFTRLSPPGDVAKADSLLLGGKEGLAILRHNDGKWTRLAPPVPSGESAGVGEVRLGSLGANAQFITTVEPMHGSQLVAYVSQKSADGPTKILRYLLTDHLTEGHALACGDLLGGNSDQIVVGWRGKVGATGSTTGVAVWTSLDATGEKWRETIIDPDGMACEDLLLADLDGDGKLDIVASGRATKNVKVYFNETPR